ncbi:zf-HC2 domain-containing protein [bacterium]|nr:zf-HC2 domain-containing protein [bacterium]
MSEINCGIIMDLLPLYAENMLGEDSRKTVEEHLASCGECMDKYEQMTRKVAVPEITNEEEAKPLKKFRFHVLFNIIGFPLWLPLLLAAAITALSLFFSFWVTVICLWCVPISFGASMVACIAGSVVAITQGYFGNAFITLGGFFIAGGITIFSYFGCLWLTKKFVFISSYLTGRLTRLFGKGKKYND